MALNNKVYTDADFSSFFCRTCRYPCCLRKNHTIIFILIWTTYCPFPNDLSHSVKTSHWEYLSHAASGNSTHCLYLSAALQQCNVHMTTCSSKQLPENTKWLHLVRSWAELLNKISDHSRGPDSAMNMNGAQHRGEDKQSMKKELLWKCLLYLPRGECILHLSMSGIFLLTHAGRTKLFSFFFFFFISDQTLSCQSD